MSNRMAVPPRGTLVHLNRGRIEEASNRLVLLNSWLFGYTVDGPWLFDCNIIVVIPYTRISLID